jgi:type I site-specific restriction-modification system R (restriction) subunit
MEIIMQDEKDEVFGDVIFSYTDKQAIEDGVLVDVSEAKVVFNGVAVNRMTRGLWDEMEKFLVDYSSAGELFGVKMPSKIEQLAKILKTKLQYAKKSGEDDYLFVLPIDIWMVKNEVNGYTLMKPEEY